MNRTPLDTVPSAGRVTKSRDLQPQILEICLEIRDKIKLNLDVLYELELCC